jgi:Sulfotransferase family
MSPSGRNHGKEAWLEPLLVDYGGRDGSTLMMRLLASSSQIAVGPEYPYEEKYFTYLWFWSRLLEREDFPPERWHHGHTGSLALESSVPMVGPPPWRTLELFEPDSSEGPISRRAFDLVWTEFSKRATHVTRRLHGGENDVRLYAEKHLMTWRVDLEPLPPLKVLALVRDPRDVWVSVRAVNAQRWGKDEPLIGRDPVESEDEWLARFLDDQRERVRWITSLSGTETPVFRYEDLIEDLPGQAERLERWLGVTIDVASVLADDSLRARHASTRSAPESIGRWREELSSADASHLSKELEPELEALGYS